MGIVRSQRSDDVYACHLDAKGVFSCRLMDLTSCQGQGGDPGACKACKHLVVLILGLVRQGLLPSSDAERWIAAAATKGISRDKATAAEAILRYRATLAGELDWRPIESIPEDYYTV